jgi:hypothetical protein
MRGLRWLMFACMLAAGCATATFADAGIDTRHHAVHHDDVRRELTTARMPTLTRLLISDMSEPSERMPEGVPASYDWASHPQRRSLTPVRDFRAFTAWGQLYQCAGTTPTGDETVELKNLQTWVLLRSSRRWLRIQFASDIVGAAFPENYHGETVPARYIASRTGTFVRPVRGRNFHFWPSAGRVSLRAPQVVGVVVAVEARLRLSGALGAAGPCLVLSAGGDMWRSLTNQPSSSSNGDVGVGRFKQVERRWRVFTMTTAAPDLLERIQVPPIAAADQEF